MGSFSVHPESWVDSALSSGPSDCLGMIFGGGVGFGGGSCHNPVSTCERLTRNQHNCSHLCYCLFKQAFPSGPRQKVTFSQGLPRRLITFPVLICALTFGVPVIQFVDVEVCLHLLRISTLDCSLMSVVSCWIINRQFPECCLLITKFPRCASPSLLPAQLPPASANLSSSFVIIFYSILKWLSG